VNHYRKHYCKIRNKVFGGWVKKQECRQKECKYLTICRNIHRRLAYLAIQYKLYRRDTCNIYIDGSCSLLFKWFQYNSPNTLTICSYILEPFNSRILNRGAGKLDYIYSTTCISHYLCVYPINLLQKWLYCTKSIDKYIIFTT